MILDPTFERFVALTFGVIVFILLMFLPAMLELKKPRDAGPRRILDELVGWRSLEASSLENAEDVEIDPAVKRKMAEVMSVLLDLDT